MLQLRKAGERGHSEIGWLNSWHSFSFSDYHDPAHKGFRSLRVINDDRVIGGAGFGAHPHRDMEIISYVVDGTLAHKDNTGNAEYVHAGEVQVMSAGTGIVHSEFNASPSDPVHFLQMWVIPDRAGYKPGYGQRRVDGEDTLNRFALLAGPESAEDLPSGALTVRQDAYLYSGRIEPGQSATHSLAAGRGAWLQVVRGSARIGDLDVRAGDGVAIEDEDTITVTVAGEAAEPAELVLFDLR